MTSIIPFKFEQQDIRVLLIDNEPWFIAKDVCEVLAIKNPSDAYSRIDKFDKRELSTDTLIGLTDDPSVTRLLAISESGLYDLVLSSRKPEARAFRKWVTSEVLTSIRKTGSYSLERSSDLLDINLLQHEMIGTALRELKNQRQQLLVYQEVLQKQGARIDQQESVTTGLSQAVGSIQERFEVVDRIAGALPTATEDVPEKSLRSSLNELVRSYAYRTGRPYSDIWSDLYREYRYRHHVDLVQRARNQHMRTLDYVEQVGAMDMFYALSLQLLNQAPCNLQLN